MSIIDYINGRGGDSSFAARKELWTNWKPNEEYEGSAAQNTELLEVLKRHFDEGPTVTVITETVSTGEEVKVTVDRAVTMSYFLSLSSFDVVASTEVSIGDAKVGSFVLRATDGTREFFGEVFIWPTAVADQLQVLLVEGSIQDPATPEPTEEETTLFKKFIDSLDSDALRLAATDVFPSWIADNVAQLSTTTLYCIATPIAGCALSGGQVFIDYGIAILNKLLETHPTLTNDEKTTLKRIFDVINAGIQFIGVDLFNPKKLKSVCGATGAIGAIGDVLSDQIETQSVRMVVNLAFQEARKITLIVCDIAPL